MERFSILSQDIRSRLKSIEKLLDDEEGKSKPSRIIHLKNNPFELAVKQRESKYEDIKKENEQLKARLELLESGNSADVTRRIDDAVNNAHQIENLTRTIHELKRREEKILDAFRKTSREFREACYLLLGYRIDALKDRIYRLSHIYAENQDDKLLFEIDRLGNVQLLQNAYSDQLSEYIRTYLENGDSFPAFLAAITLDLFKSSTQLAQTSMSMSETVMQPSNQQNKFARP